MHREIVEPRSRKTRTHRQVNGKDSGFTNCWIILSVWDLFYLNRQSQIMCACYRRSFIAVHRSLSGSTESLNLMEFDLSTFKLVRIDRIVLRCWAAAFNDRLAIVDPHGHSSTLPQSNIPSILSSTKTAKASCEHRQACSFTTVIQIEFLISIIRIVL